MFEQTVKMTQEDRILSLVKEFTRAGLGKRCALGGLPVTGTKEDMARILVENEGKQSELDITTAEGYQDAVQDNAAHYQAEVTLPYSFRDVEEGIDGFSADGSRDLTAWFAGFDEIASLARWPDEHKFIMCRKKMTGVAKSFLATLSDHLCCAKESLAVKVCNRGAGKRRLPTIGFAEKEKGEVFSRIHILDAKTCTVHRHRGNTNKSDGLIFSVYLCWCRYIQKCTFFRCAKTMHSTNQQYFIPHLEQKVKQVMNSCVKCIIHNKKLGKKEGFLNPIDKGCNPLQTIHLDHIGPMDITAKQYKYILMVVDAFSKFVWLYPTKSTGTEEVVSKLQS